MNDEPDPEQKVTELMEETTEYAEEPTDPEGSTEEPTDPEGPIEEASASEYAPVTGSESPADDDEGEREFDRRERRLDEREMGLEKRSEDLDEREQELDEREELLDEHREELEKRFKDLQDSEAELKQRKEELDERANEIEGTEEELDERARKLNEHEETLHRYIKEQTEDLETDIQETIWSALDSYEEVRGVGRFGTTGTLLAGLAGLVLVAAGVGYGVGTVLGGGALLFPSVAANYIVAAALLVVGLAANLVTLTDRI
jgi:ribonuclease Y